MLRSIERALGPVWIRALTWGVWERLALEANFLWNRSVIREMLFTGKAHELWHPWCSVVPVLYHTVKRQSARDPACGTCSLDEDVVETFWKPRKGVFCEAEVSPCCWVQLFKTQPRASGDHTLCLTGETTWLQSGLLQALLNSSAGLSWTCLDDKGIRILKWEATKFWITLAYELNISDSYSMGLSPRWSFAVFWHVEDPCELYRGENPNLCTFLVQWGSFLWALFAFTMPLRAQIALPSCRNFL